MLMVLISKMQINKPEFGYWGSLQELSLMTNEHIYSIYTYCEFVQIFIQRAYKDIFTYRLCLHACEALIFIEYSLGTKVCASHFTKRNSSAKTVLEIASFLVVRWTFLFLFTIPAHGRLGQKDHEFKTTFDNIDNEGLVWAIRNTVSQNNNIFISRLLQTFQIY